MNTEFFALAFASTLNPKLPAVDLLLIENRRPRAMFSCFLLGGMTVALTIGLLDVLVFHADALKAQGTVSAGVDLALGLLLLAAWRADGNRAPARPPEGTRPGRDGRPEKKEKRDGWVQRVLSEPRLGLAMLAGALAGIPGASYLTALHNLVTGKSSTAAQVVAVAVFVRIEFSLVFLPFAFLGGRLPGRTGDEGSHHVGSCRSRLPRARSGGLRYHNCLNACPGVGVQPPRPLASSMRLKRACKCSAALGPSNEETRSDDQAPHTISRSSRRAKHAYLGTRGEDSTLKRRSCAYGRAISARAARAGVTITADHPFRGDARVMRTTARCGNVVQCRRCAECG
jgi:hypothetical protein